MMCSLGYKTNEACSESLQVLRGEKEKQSKKKPSGNFRNWKAVLEETDEWSKMPKKYTLITWLSPPRDITHPEQYKLSETKISTFSKGLQENLVNPTSDFFDDLC